MKAFIAIASMLLATSTFAVSGWECTPLNKEKIGYLDLKNDITRISLLTITEGKAGEGGAGIKMVVKGKNLGNEKTSTLYLPWAGSNTTETYSGHTYQNFPTNPTPNAPQVIFEIESVKPFKKLRAVLTTAVAKPFYVVTSSFDCVVTE